MPLRQFFKACRPFLTEFVLSILAALGRDSRSKAHTFLHVLLRKILSGGVLQFGGKEDGGAFTAFAPQAWKFIESDEPLTTMMRSARSWSDASLLAIDWTANAEGPLPQHYGNYWLKILDGGLLLFKPKDPVQKGSFIVAPHAWTRLKGGFDFAD